MSVKISRLPCRVHVSTGDCPFRGRCSFLHDSRISSHSSEKRHSTRRRNVDETITDSFYWPPMPSIQSMRGNNCPYIVFITHPVNREEFPREVEYVFSMWNHFVDYLTCKTSDPRSPQNEYMHRPRLSVFINLAQGKSLENGNTDSQYQDEDFPLQSTIKSMNLPTIAKQCHWSSTSANTSTLASYIVQ
jgi:hypothetical protein